MTDTDVRTVLVRVLRSFAGPYASGKEGEVVRLPEDEANKAIRAGFVAPAFEKRERVRTIR